MLSESVACFAQLHHLALQQHLFLWGFVPCEHTPLLPSEMAYEPVERSLATCEFAPR